jgi:hypothetical protein
MIYFKKIEFPYPGKEQTEIALRKFAVKRTSSLDNISSSAVAGTDKIFVGFEKANDVQFARIRYLIEGYLPKVIISIPKDKGDDSLKFRLSLISTLVFLGLSGFVLLSLFLVIAANNDDALEVISFFGFIYLIYLFLIFLEIRITQKGIKKAIRKFEESKNAPL